MYYLCWTFFLYAFLGWCTEVGYAALTSGRFVNRGFLNGPFCPIYGLGVLVVLFFLDPLREHTLFLFLGSVLLTSLLEWLTGFILEKLFHQRWWDYSQEPFNLGGYICLRFSIAWGLACLLVVDIIHPSILWLIRLIPYPLGIGLLTVFSVGMLIDLVATVHTIVRMNHQLTQLDELAGRIKSLSNELGENLAERVLDAAERSSILREDLQENLDEVKGTLSQYRDDLQENLEDVKDALAQRRMQHQMDQFERQEQRQRDLAELRTKLEEAMSRPILGQRRLMRAFPKMRSTKHNQALERLRQWKERHSA